MLKEITQYNLYLRLFGLTKIPLLFFCSPKIVELGNEKVILKIPLKKMTKNHLNSMYFGALAVGADCAAGLLATKFIRESKKKVHLSFKSIHGDFLKRAEGDAYFINDQGKEICAVVQEVISNPGLRKNIDIHIRVETKVKNKNPGHENLDTQEILHVAQFTLTLSLKHKD